MKQKTLHILILFQLLLFFQSVGFSIELKGKVIDETGLPISMVKVYETVSQKGTITEVDGTFNLILKKRDVYKIRFSQVGYATQFIEINPTENLHDITITLQKNYKLKTIEVNGKTEGEKQDIKGFEVEVVKLKNIQNTTTDINQILKSTSGINIRESGGLGSDFVLSLNGLSGNQIRYFIDGVPMENFGSSLTLNNFPVGQIESIEVYKGAIPIHLSADALGGAINIITNKKLLSFLDVSYSSGSFKTHRFSMNSQYVFKNKSSIRFSSFLNSTANNYWMDSIPVYDLELGNFEGFQRVQRWHDQYKSGMVKLEYAIVQKKWTDRFSISTTVAANRKNYQHPNNNLKRIFNDFHTKNKTALLNLNYVKHFNKLKASVFSSIGLIEENVIDTGSFKYNWTADFIERSKDDPKGELFERRSHFIQTDFLLRNQIGFTYKLSDRYSLESYYNINFFQRQGVDIVNDFNNSFESPNFLQKDILSFAYAYVSKTKKLRATVFAKQYWFKGKIITNDYEGNEIVTETNSNSLGYGLASSYNLSKSFRIKASFERAYRMPEAYEALGDGIYINPNPELLPEESFNYNIGFVLKKSIKKLSFEVSSNSFFRISDNFIRFNPVGPFGQFENLQQTNAKGIESGFVIQWNKKLSLAANTTYQHITDEAEFDEGLPNTNYKSRIPNVPWFFANARISYRTPLRNKNQRLGFSLSNRYIHSFFLKWEALGSAASKHTIPKQFVQDFNLEYSFGNGKYNTSLTVQNIFNRTVYDNFSIPRPGRTIFLKIRYQIINNKKAKNENANKKI